MRGSRSSVVIAIAAVAMLALAVSANAAIVIVNQVEGFRGNNKSQVTTSHNGTTQVSYDATGVDKLVVAIGTEWGFNNQKVTSVGVTFNGVALTQAVQDNYAPPGSAPYSNDGGYAGIFYLDDPFQGAANFSLTTTTTGGGPNGGHVSIIGLSGTADGVGNTGANWTSQGSAGNVSTSVTTSFNNSLVIAAAENSGSNNGAGTPNAVGTLTLSNNGQWGSSGGWAGVASGHESVPISGTTITPTFSTNAGGSIHVVAAEFKEASAPPPPPSPELTLGDRTLVSVNNANFNISVFDGKAFYDNAGTSDPPINVTLGDGTVMDYNLIVSRSGQTDPLSYADGGAGRTPDPYDPNPGSGGWSNNNGQNWANVWTVSDPDTDPKDFISGAINTTHAGHAEIEGTVDISNMTSGTLYFPHGTYINQWSLTLTMTGSGQPDLTAVDSQGNGPGTNFGWITDFSFTNPDLTYDTITYNYVHGDADGSRARFMGVILDGNVVPEPVTMLALGLSVASLGRYVRKRRRA